MCNKSWYLKSLEEEYKEEYKWKNMLFVWSKSLFLSGKKSINDETIKSNTEDVLKQINSIVWYWININFLTDYSYKWLREKLWVEEEQYFYTSWDLIDSSFEVSKKIWVDKVIYLTKKTITWLIYWKKEKLNYINSSILNKVDIKWKNGIVIKKILWLLENNIVNRFHFVNILKNNALYNELFTLYWEWNWDWVLVSLDYKLEIEKMKNVSEIELLFLYSILEDLSKNNWFVKHKEFSYIEENINNFYVYKIDWASVGMFEVKELWNFSKEIGTVILDQNFQWGGIWYRMIEKIIELKKTYEYKYFNFILVTWNKSLKNIFLKEEDINLIKNDIISRDIDLERRYDLMLKENKEDWKNREMFIIS